MVAAPHQLAGMLEVWATCMLGVRPHADVGLRRSKDGEITLWVKAGKAGAEQKEIRPGERCATSPRYAETVFSMAASQWKADLNAAADAAAKEKRKKEQK